MWILLNPLHSRRLCNFSFKHPLVKETTPFSIEVIKWHLSVCTCNACCKVSAGCTKMYMFLSSMMTLMWLDCYLRLAWVFMVKRFVRCIHTSVVIMHICCELCDNAVYLCSNVQLSECHCLPFHCYCQVERYFLIAFSIDSVF